MKERHAEKALLLFSPIWVIKHLTGRGEVKTHLHRQTLRYKLYIFSLLCEI